MELPMCACETFYKTHHPDCPVRREIEQLRAECLRLQHAEAEAMAVVLSQEGQIEKLQCDVTGLRASIVRLQEELRRAALRGEEPEA